MTPNESSNITGKSISYPDYTNINGIIMCGLCNKEKYGLWPNGCVCIKNVGIKTEIKTTAVCPHCGKHI